MKIIAKQILSFLILPEILLLVTQEILSFNFVLLLLIQMGVQQQVLLGLLQLKTSWDADSESNDMKQSSSGGVDNWDPLRYLNIWVCNLSNSSGGGQTLGYAYLPGLQGSNSQSWKDGLVVDYMFFGTTGSVSSSSDGRTTTHEIGHYLGLSHTFCETGGCCDNDLDSQYGWGDVDDTPATEEIYFGPVNSNTSNNTCNDLSYSNVFTTNVLDMDENYMSMQVIHGCSLKGK